MIAVFLALLSSICVGITTILMKKGVERTNPATAMLAVTIVGTAILLTISFITVPTHSLKSRSLIYFILAGLLSPTIVRWLFFISLQRIGASISSSIIATGPAFTAIIAIFLLDETLTLLIGLGTVCIIAGVIVLERDMNGNNRLNPRRRRDLVLALASAIALGAAVVLRKMGLNILNSPILGVTAGFVTSLILYSIICAFSKKVRKSIILRKGDILYLCAAGTFMTLSWLMIFFALSYGDAVIVMPLSNLHPLVVVLLSTIFLKDVERVSKKIFLGVFIVVAGVLFITIGGNAG